MNEKKWTPGVWITTAGNDLLLTLCNGGKEIVELGWLGDNPQESDANACLISAAPDLYEALEAALPRLAHKFECGRVKPTSEWADGGSWDFSSCNCEIRTVKAALAKARGESHDQHD